MPRVVILVAWRGGDPVREAHWEFVRRWLDTLGYPVYTSSCDDGPFNLSQATNRASALADTDGRWDVALLAGADCVVPKLQLDEAIQTALDHECIVLPHDQYVRIGQRQTEEYIRLGGVIPPGQAGKHLLRDAVTNRKAPAGFVTMPRVVWDRVGGYDERFRGWGFEDAAMLVSAGYFERLPGPIYHLWHPVGRVAATPEAAANLDLWRAEYRGRAPEWMLVGDGKLG